MPFSSRRDLGRVDTSHENLPVGLVGSTSPSMPRRRMDGIGEAEAEAEFEAEAEAEEAAISRADGAPGEAATKLHAAKMSAARMNAARLLNGQSNDAGSYGAMQCMQMMWICQPTIICLASEPAK